jgi:fibro-slime domain-containing protein
LIGGWLVIVPDHSHPVRYGRLAIDLGGVHGASTGTYTLTAPKAIAIGLTQGQTYNLDFFQANRHTTSRTSTCKRRCA